MAAPGWAGCLTGAGTQRQLVVAPRAAAARVGVMRAQVEPALQAGLQPVAAGPLAGAAGCPAPGLAWGGRGFEPAPATPWSGRPSAVVAWEGPGCFCCGGGGTCGRGGGGARTKLPVPSVLATQAAQPSAPMPHLKPAGQWMASAPEPAAQLRWQKAQRGVPSSVVPHLLFWAAQQRCAPSAGPQVSWLPSAAQASVVRGGCGANWAAAGASNVSSSAARSSSPRRRLMLAGWPEWAVNAGKEPTPHTGVGGAENPCRPAAGLTAAADDAFLSE